MKIYRSMFGLQFYIEVCYEGRKQHKHPVNITRGELEVHHVIASSLTAETLRNILAAKCKHDKCTASEKVPNCLKLKPYACRREKAAHMHGQRHAMFCISHKYWMHTINRDPAPPTPSLLPCPPCKPPSETSGRLVPRVTRG